MLVKQLKSCESNMKKLSNSIKRPNLRIMGIKEGEEDQANESSNILQIYYLNYYYFSNLKKVLPIQVQNLQDTKQTYPK
jgi:hypothetical protein